MRGGVAISAEEDLSLLMIRFVVTVAVTGASSGVGRVLLLLARLTVRYDQYDQWGWGEEKVR